MGLIYRGETRFDLKGSIPVKLPLILRGQPQIIARVDCSLAKKTWRNAGILEQFTFVSGLGNVTISNTTILFGKDTLMDLRIAEPSYLRFTPVNWLVYRANIQITTTTMPLYNAQQVSGIVDIIPSNQSDISEVQVLNSGVILLPVNPLRKGYSIYNKGESTIYLGNSDSVNSTDNFFVAITKGGFYEAQSGSVYTGAIWAISEDESLVQAYEFDVLAV
jgi:hypothetical protein